MEIIKQLHLAAQYLAAAGKSFLEHKSDDSHTNLEFSIAEKSLLTWPLGDSNTQLSLNYETFSLEWKSSSSESFSLKGKTQQEVVTWITKRAENFKFIKPYTYNLHYTLPYSMSNEEKFATIDTHEINELIRLRTLAQNVISKFLEAEKLESDIRIWPHHFDTGAFAHLHDGSGKSVGLGMAIPDTLCNDFYFYISGYRGHDSLNTWAFPTLSNGKWINDGFKGAILPASNVDDIIAVQFFREALRNYKKDTF
ncbi:MULTISPECIES: hypothetical protein [Flavobacteriaceae]|uniref:hypothetical protein n=1 Tax=Flavobacteriaceae TaxID=49546 RepID=UPI0014912EE7|nr:MULTISPECIES: hypothetical protein [Allomuricauda]MDC6365949.1 hypothetical protein [Muricauda sp. AC10]